MNSLQQIKDKLVKGNIIKKEKTYCSMLEIERELYPDTFNERKKRIEERLNSY